MVWLDRLARSQPTASLTSHPNQPQHGLLSAWNAERDLHCGWLSLACKTSLCSLTAVTEKPGNERG